MVSMSVKEIEKILITEVTSILSMDQDGVSADAPFHALGMDSMAFVELLVAIERKFNLNLMESELTKEDFQTISSLASCIGKMK